MLCFGVRSVPSCDNFPRTQRTVVSLTTPMRYHLATLLPNVRCITITASR